METQVTGFRFYYDKSLDYLIKEELENNREYTAIRLAKARLRMYANLFIRDLRKIIVNDASECIKCFSKENLQLDHIEPIAKGGKNEADNIQILCKKCNNFKRDKPNGIHRLDKIT